MHTSIFRKSAVYMQCPWMSYKQSISLPPDEWIHRHSRHLPVLGMDQRWKWMSIMCILLAL